VNVAGECLRMLFTLAVRQFGEILFAFTTEIATILTAAQSRIPHLPQKEPWKHIGVTFLVF
jgi:hypothetical protein